MSLIFGLKLVLVPVLIGTVTLAGRRWGPAIAGWLSGFPIVTGPILFFIAHEQGSAFGAIAALGTLIGMPAVLAFNVTYAHLAMKVIWPFALAGALIAYGLVVSILVALAVPSWASIGMVVTLLYFGPRFFPRTAEVLAKPGNSGHADIAYRMAAAAVLVVGVTYFASALGPQLSGVFAMFPLISIVLASFSHHYSGPEFVTRLLKGVILGWYALAVFCLLLYLLLPVWPQAAAFAGATIGASLVQLTSRKRVEPKRIMP